MKRFFVAALAVVLALPAVAMSDVITQWDFNFGNDANSATGTTAPSLGAGTISNIGGTTTTFAGGTLTPSQSTDPNQGPDNSAWNLTNFSSTTQLVSGLQGNVSTAGYQNIVVSWDQRHSNSSSKYVAFRYTLDGINWTQVTNSALLTAGTLSGTPNPGPDSVDPSGLFVGGSGDRFHNQRSVNLSSIVGVANNPLFGFQVLSAFDPNTVNTFTGTNGTFTTGGTWRFDMVTVSGDLIPVIPEPSSLCVLGLLGLAGLLRRRVR